MATIDVKDAAGATVALERPLTPGQAAMAASRPVVIASNQSAVPISGTVTANAGTGTMAVSGTVTANAGTGTMTVSGTVAATQSGTWNVGTVTPGTAATNLGKAIDSAVGATDTGTGTLVKRVDTLATLTPANGDWVAAQVDAQGAMWVRLIPEQVEAGEYEAVAAGAGTTVLGTSGASGDFLSSVIITPTTTSPGSVGIKDGTNTAITIFAGGASSVSNLVPFAIPIGATATGGTGGWQIVIGGTGVTAIGVGNFS
jgi:hypothetical protein